MPAEPQSRTSPTFDAIVVACDSGPAVRRAIAALPDARRCILLDPSGLISDEELPAHAIRVGSAAAALAASDAAWVLLTTDGEVLPAGTFDAVIRAITPSTAPDGVRVVIPLI